MLTFIVSDIDRPRIVLKPLNHAAYSTLSLEERSI